MKYSKLTQEDIKRMKENDKDCFIKICELYNKLRHQFNCVKHKDIINIEDATLYIPNEEMHLRFAKYFPTPIVIYPKDDKQIDDVTFSNCIKKHFQSLGDEVSACIYDYDSNKGKLIFANDVRKLQLDKLTDIANIDKTQTEQYICIVKSLNVPSANEIYSLIEFLSLGSENENTRECCSELGIDYKEFKEIAETHLDSDKTLDINICYYIHPSNLGTDDVKFLHHHNSEFYDNLKFKVDKQYPWNPMIDKTIKTDIKFNLEDIHKIIKMDDKEVINKSTFRI